MTGLKILAIFSLVLSPSLTLYQEKRPVPGDSERLPVPPETITGTVVAYDPAGFKLSNGICRQELIVRKHNTKRHQKGEYVIIRYMQEDCKKLLPERFLKTGPRRDFYLSRKADCDQTFDEVSFYTELDEVEGVWRILKIKRVPTRVAENIPAGKKLPCYELRPGGMNPPLRERAITGVVVGDSGLPIGESYVLLKYADAEPISTTKTDPQGHFSIPIFESYEYIIQAYAVKANGMIANGEPVRIPATGNIGPLKLFAKWLVTDNRCDKMACVQPLTEAICNNL